METHRGLSVGQTELKVQQGFRLDGQLCTQQLHQRWVVLLRLRMEETTRHHFLHFLTGYDILCHYLSYKTKSAFHIFDHFLAFAYTSEKLQTRWGANLAEKHIIWCFSVSKAK